MPLSEQEKHRNTARKLLSTAHQQEAELATSLPEFHKDMEPNSEEEGKDMQAPILESVYLLEGQQGLIMLTNFTSDKFKEL